MKKVIFLTLVIFLSLISKGFAQRNDMLIFKKGSWSSKYILNGQELSMKETSVMLEKENLEAYNILKKARVAGGFGTVTGTIGGGMIGWELGNLISGKKFNTTVGGIGAGIAIISVILEYNATKKFKKVAELYNNSKKSTSFLQRFELNVKESNQVGVIFSF